MAGVSGNSGRRFAVVAAIRRTRLSGNSGGTADIAVSMIGTWPETTSLHRRRDAAIAAHASSVMPAARMNSSMPTCCGLPGPPEA